MANSPRVVIYDADGENPLTGQQASSGSLPVVFAHDQSTLPISGTVGMVLNGAPVSTTNPIPITGSDISVVVKGGVTVNISASLPLTASISNFPATQVVSASNWVPTVTGSVSISAAVAVTQGTSPWVVSGSNWVPQITGSVVVANRVDVTGSNWTPTVNQGTSPWSVTFGALGAANIFADYAQNTGSSAMNVNGATTNVFFAVKATTKTIHVTQVKLLMSDNSTGVGSSKFGALAELTNGVKLQVLSGSTVIDIATLTINEHFLEANGGFALDQSGAADVIGATYTLAQDLVANSTDQIRVVIRDNLTSLEYFKCRVYGTKDI